MIFYIIPIFYHFVNVSASQRIKMCYNERMENNAFFWKTRRGNSGAGASLSAFSGGSFRSADPMKARLRTDPMKKLLCLLPVLLLLLLRAAGAETLWYAPEWYDAATGSMDLTGLDLSGVEGAARGWLERRLCEVPGLQYVDLSFSSLSDEELSALRGSMAEKGVKDALILMKETALVVSVKNRTVITAVDEASAKENIFTNIDSAAIL